MSPDPMYSKTRFRREQPIAHSEREGKAKLPLSWQEVATDDAEVRVCYASIWILEIHVIEHIEEICLEIEEHASVLSKTYSFAHRKVPVLISRPEYAAGGYASVSETEPLRLCETARLEPLANGARILSAASTRKYRGPFPRDFL